MKRGGKISPTSRKRVDSLGKRAEIRVRVFSRDRQCLLSPFLALNKEGRDWGRCFGYPLTAHHLLKASQGGEYTEENLVTLCAGHNDMIEDYPEAAHAIGLVIKPWEK